MLAPVGGCLLAGAPSTAAFTASVLVTKEPGTLSPPSAGATQPGVGYLMIRIEPKDPPGVYRIKAHTKDQVADTVVDGEHRLQVDPARSTDVPQWPAGRPKPVLAGFWKDHGEDEFGLKIEPAGGEECSISFCGPGGCFEPGTYRPNSPTFGDQAYHVIDAETIEVLGGDGFRPTTDARHRPRRDEDLPGMR
jgi:hypothetical protein